ncbi:MAG: putative transcription elongation factor [Chlorobi bacterium]|nr:putative transcription elongation factor [Chlorobiota bacterium]
MSRAFVNEDNDQPEELPEIPQSPNPGYITAAGLAGLKAELARLETVDRPPLETAIAGGGGEAGQAETELARIRQRVKYLEARIARAIVTDPAAAAPDHVHFGAIVTVRDQSGHQMRVHIVGEDETDPEHNTVSCFSPLARALMTKQVGDIALWRRPIGDLELTVLAIEPGI